LSGVGVDGIVSTATSTAITIDANENVGIGTSSPDTKLHVEGNILCDAYSNGGVGNGIFFREGFLNTTQPSITLADHSGSAPDGLSINSYDGTSFRTADVERMRITNTGNVVHQGNNGVEVFYAHGWAGGSTALSVDVPCDNDGSSGTVFHVEASMTHHPSFDAILETWVSARGASDIRSSEQYRRNTGNSGAWSVSRTSNTNLRVSKSAGSYGGTGPWWVRVTYRRV
jgi:hypothetical protein